MAASYQNKLKESTDKTEYSAAFYGWISQVNGTTIGGQPIKITCKQIIENLKFTFMGSFEVRKNDYSFLTDVLYLKLQANKSSSIPIGGGALNINGNADVELTSWVLNFISGYKIYQNNKITTDLLVGARYLNLAGKTKLRLDAIIKQ